VIKRLSANTLSHRLYSFYHTLARLSLQFTGLFGKHFGKVVLDKQLQMGFVRENGGTFTFFREESNKEAFREVTFWIIADKFRALRWRRNIASFRAQ
jgi:hypothetical protein